MLERAGLTSAQVYTKSIHEWMKWYQTSERKLMWAIPGSVLKEEFFISLGTVDKPISALVVDSGSGERPGGTGERFDWEGAKLGIWLVEQNVPVVVAGGLNPHNVDQAIKTFRPWGVDVVSGVEASPGKKDPEKVRAFVKAVREMDRKVG